MQPNLKHSIFTPLIFLIFPALAGKQTETKISLQSQVVPVLCYHNIRPSLEKHSPAYTTSQQSFYNHMKMLHDSGYTTILPDQLYDFLTHKSSLPPKPILISFDDSKEEQFTLAGPILDRFHFKAVFFIMTVTINKPGFMTAGQIRTLSDSGNSIALHTWDHPDLRKINYNNWQQQIDEPKRTLEKITGKTTEYFAYPFGAWNETAIIQLMDRHIKAAFQLEGKMSATHPLYTIRRLQVSGSWTASTLSANIRSAFR